MSGDKWVKSWETKYVSFYRAKLTKIVTKKPTLIKVGLSVPSVFKRLP
jgi:hypothetical protein